MTDRAKLYTVDEFEQFIDLPENADRRFELIDGEIVEKLPTEEHSAVAGNIYAALRAFVNPRKMGRVLFEVRHRLPNDHDNSYVPDVEFTRAERVKPLVTQGAVPQLPDLAVEVKSPSDRLPAMRRKALYYLDNGVQLVWLVYPDTQRIEVLGVDTLKTLIMGDVLDGGDVIPGFVMPVESVFADQTA